MSSIFSYFKIIRPLNVLLSGITTYIASYILNGSNNFIIFIMCCVVMIFCIIANIINDLFDYKTDQINKPHSPMISSHNINFSYYLISIIVLLLLFTLVLSYFYFNFFSHLFLILIFILIIIYTPVLKGIPLLGNITISFILASVFLFPAIVLNCSISNVFYPVILTFLLTLIREIIKDIADIKGDQYANINTLPIAFGINFSKWLISILFIILLIVSIYPYLINIYNSIYLIFLILYVQIPLVICIFYLWKYPNSHSCVTLTITTKYITIGGVLTILSTRLFA